MAWICYFMTAGLFSDAEIDDLLCHIERAQADAAECSSVENGTLKLDFAT
jgi:hypothetical protein